MTKRAYRFDMPFKVFYESIKLNKYFYIIGLIKEQK